MNRERHKVRYRVMEILDRFGFLGLAYAIYIKAEFLNPLVLLRNARYRRAGAANGLPIPPYKLINLVAGTSDIRWFLRGGQLAVESMSSTLRKNGLDIQGLKEILDFGCGCGRVIRHLETKAALHGTDYNSELITWCKENLPFARFDTDELEPPMRYPSQTFDFIYALSVFTHMPEELQLAWMGELWRVLEDDGFLLITTHGESYVGRLNREERRQFRAGAVVVKRTKHAGANTCTAFHSEAYVRGQLARGFEVVDCIPQGAKGNPQQDVYLLRKYAGNRRRLPTAQVGNRESLDVGSVLSGALMPPKAQATDNLLLRRD